MGNYLELKKVGNLISIISLEPPNFRTEIVDVLDIVVDTLLDVVVHVRRCRGCGKPITVILVMYSLNHAPQTPHWEWGLGSYETVRGSDSWFFLVSDMSRLFYLSWA